MELARSTTTATTASRSTFASSSTTTFRRRTRIRTEVGVTGPFTRDVRPRLRLPLRRCRDRQDTGGDDHRRPDHRSLNHSLDCHVYKSLQKTVATARSLIGDLTRGRS